MRSGLNVKAILRTDKPVNKAGSRPIYLLIYNEGKQVKISTKLFVQDKYWDKKAGNVVAKRNSHDDLVFISERIPQMINDFKSEMRKKVLAGENITDKAIKAYFNGDEDSTPKEDRSFYEYYERIVKLKKPDLKPDSYRIYFTTLRMMKAFRKSLTFSELDKDFIREFDNYLKVKRKNSSGGVFNKHKNIRHVIGQAIDEGFMSKNPYVKFKRAKPNYRTLYLEKEEMKRLEEIDRTGLKPGLILTLDMFLFSCYTGLRFSDIITLRKENVDFKKQEIIKEQVKTKTKVETLLNPKAIEILKRNMDDLRPTCFQRIANSNANENLKKLMNLSSIKKSLIFHMARHTFGTFLGQNEVRIEDISRLMGHAQLKETMRYVKPAKQMMRRAVGLFDF
jgi:integrase